VSLYTAETRRLVKRRFTKLFVIGAMLVLAAIAAGVFFSNQKVSPDQIAKATAQAQSEYQQAVLQSEQEKAKCQTAQGTANAGQYPPNCEIYTPTQDDFNPQWYMPATFDFRESFPDMVTTLAAVLAVVAFVIGASFVGAEWSSGGMMNLLLWRPRRLQVLGTKLTALLVSAGVLSVVLGAIWTGVFAFIGNSRGSLDSMTSGAWQSILLMEARALGLVLVAGAVGFGLASVGRHTAMALGVAIGTIIVFQFGLGTVLSLAKVKFPELYLAPFWVFAWMNKEYRIEDYNSCDYSSNGCVPDSFTITWPMAGGLLAGIFVVIVGAAMWTMRSRDIT
jgi:ABC-type transport system involved in multi-copper enzyme maturation permease subunit